MVPCDFEENPLGALRIATELAQDNYEVDVTMGDAGTEILLVARRLRANLIVMATHGRKGVRRLILGSVAERVVREAPCPVLTVRPQEAPSRSSRAPSRKPKQR